jgi:hypothetical protein
MHYDGKSKLADAIADLYGYSPRNHNKIAELIQQAKTGLGITGKARVMPDDIKQDIYRWLSDRLNLVQNAKQADNCQIDLFQSAAKNVVQTIKPTNGKQALPFDSPIQTVKPDDAVQHVKQSAPVKRHNSNNGLTPDDFDQLHFGVTITHQGQAKRTTIMLEGYWVKALQRKYGLANNATIRAWIEQELKADAGKFDSQEALTKQVKRMMIESFV